MTGTTESGEKGIAAGEGSKVASPIAAEKYLIRYKISCEQKSNTRPRKIKCFS